MRLLSYIALVVFAVSLTACGSDKTNPKNKPAKAAAAEADDDATEGPGEPKPAGPAEGDDDEAQPAANTAETNKTRESEVPGDVEITDTVVAKVNGVPIDIKDHVDQIRKRNNGKAMRSKVRQSVVERLINEELIRQAIQAANIQVTDAEIAEEMGVDLAKYQADKAGMGKRVDNYRDRIGLRKLLTARGLVQEPTDADLQKQYDQGFRINLEVAVFRLPANPTEADKANATQSAEKVLAAVRGGASLKDATKDSQDFNGRKVNVRPMQVRKTDERYKAYWDKTATLPEKAYDLLVLPDSVTVFQVVKRFEPKDTFEKSKPDLRRTILQTRTTTARHRLIQDLRTNAKIEYIIKFDDNPARPGVPPAGAINPNTRLNRNIGKPPAVAPQAIRSHESATGGANAAARSGQTAPQPGNPVQPVNTPAQPVAPVQK